MTNLDLFTAALNIQKPWKVLDVRFAVFDKNPSPKPHITIGYDKGAEFSCPEDGCGSRCKIYDSQERTWRHLNFFQYKTYIHAKPLRVSCDKHGIRTIGVPWSSQGSGFTILFEALVLELAKRMAVSEIARITGECDMRLWRFIRRYVSSSRNEKDESGVASLGINETSIKGRNYATVFADIENKEALYVAKGKDSATVDAFKADFARGARASRTT